MNKSKWCDDQSFVTSCHLDSDTADIVNPLDKDPLKYKNIDQHAQYHHGSVNVNGTNIYASLIICEVET